MEKLNIPIWKQTMLSPTEFSLYANLSLPIVYDLCNKKRLPCIRTAKGFKIHREEADKKLAQMALDHEGHIERHRAEEITITNSKRRRKAQ